MSAHASDKFEFKAEIQQLLQILVHSLYSNKEIFLRELVSNASDALDKVRFELQRGTDILSPDMPQEIRISADADANTLTIADTGIGMTRDELVRNLGTIAHSGTADFVKRLAEAKDEARMDSIIGQFGVGFYSVFMVADEVELTTRSASPGEPAWVWTSDGKGTFTITPGPEDAPRGTSILVKLKEDEKKYADPDVLRGVINRHSQFISFPIFVGEEQANTISALWREPKFSIKPEQYSEFYKFLTFDSDDPLEVIHHSADAPIQFNSLLFIPKVNHDLLMGTYQGPRGLDLYVRRILIQHENKDILPEYLGFLRGVVDSEDLPLNISRETLQENILLKKISSTLVKHVLGQLAKLAEDEEKYAEFWKQHGKIFKLGYSDFINREKFAELLRFNSSACEDGEGLVSLKQYVERAKPTQKEIYYISGSSRAALETSPHLEIFRKKGVEVLYLVEPIDEFVMDALRTYNDFTLVSAENADLAKLEALADAEAAEEAPRAEELSSEDQDRFEALLKRMKDILGERVTEVRVSKRLKDSPVCLVSADGQMTSSMQKIMRIMTKDESAPQKVMEVNRDNRLIRNLLDIFKKNEDDDYIGLAVEQLYESALLLEGYLNDPQGLVHRIQEHLNRSSEWYKERK